MNKPATSFEFIAAWFEKAQANAALQGKKDSAMLWRDGLEHLHHFKAQRDELLDALKALAEGDDILRRLGSHGYAKGSPIDKAWGKARATIQRIEQ